MPAPERFRRLVLEAQSAGRLPSVSAAVFRGDEDIERAVELIPRALGALARA